MDRPWIYFSGLHSVNDLGLVITDIKRVKGKKKRATCEVPFSNHTPDFSRVNGKYAYGERTDTYTFVVKASTPQELEKKLGAVNEWLEAPRGDMRDSCFLDMHFRDSMCVSVDVAYISPIYAKVTAKFNSYPYHILDYTRPAYYTLTTTMAEHTYELPVNKEIIPCFTPSQHCGVLYGGVYYDVPAGVERYQISDIKFTQGVNSFSLIGDGELTIECIEEVL